MFLRKSDKKKKDSSGEYVSRPNSTHDLVRDALRDALFLNQVTDEIRQKKIRKLENGSKRSIKAWEQAEYKANNIVNVILTNPPKLEQSENNANDLLLMSPPKRVMELKEAEKAYIKQINMSHPYLNGGNTQYKRKLSPIMEWETQKPGMKR